VRDICRSAFQATRSGEPIGPVGFDEQESHFEKVDERHWRSVGSLSDFGGKRPGLQARSSACGVESGSGTGRRCITSSACRADEPIGPVVGIDAVPYGYVCRCDAYVPAVEAVDKQCLRRSGIVHGRLPRHCADDLSAWLLRNLAPDLPLREPASPSLFDSPLSVAFVLRPSTLQTPGSSVSVLACWQASEAERRRAPTRTAPGA